MSRVGTMTTLLSLTVKPGIALGWSVILELAETEEDLLDYLKDVSEFTRDEKGNN